MIDDRIIFQTQRGVCTGCTASPYEAIARAAGVSHGKQAANPRELVTRLLKMGHGTPFEFVNLDFSIRTDRGVSHELVRHRVGVSFIQRSTRYCEEIPLNVICPEDCREVMMPVFVAAANAYSALRAGEKSRQVARDVLPTCTVTWLSMRINVRAFRHMLRFRMAPEALPKMRELMRLLLDDAVRVLAMNSDGDEDTWRTILTFKAENGE